MAAKAIRQTGRPSHYTEEIAAEICARLAEGESLLSICKAAKMPAERTVRAWVLDDHEAFAARYNRARNFWSDHIAEEIIEISDSVRIGVKKEKGVGLNGPVEKTITGDMVERARLQVESRKWILSKVLPKRYGEKLALEHDVAKPVEIIVRRVWEGAKG